MDQLTDTRANVDVDATAVIGRRHAVQVGQRDRALRSGMYAAAGVTLEQRTDLALAGGDDDEVVAVGQPIQVGEAGFVDFERSAETFEFPHSARHLQALIDRLARHHLRVELDGEAFLRGAGMGMKALQRGAAVVQKARPNSRSISTAGPYID